MLRVPTFHLGVLYPCIRRSLQPAPSTVQVILVAGLRVKMMTKKRMMTQPISAGRPDTVARSIVILRRMKSWTRIRM
jgi:hypothetical protein